MSTSSTSADKCSKYKCRTEVYRDPIALDGTIPYDLDKIPMRRRRHVKREAISSHRTKLNHSELSTISNPSQTFIIGDISIAPDGEDEGWIYQHTLKHEHTYQQLDDKMKVFAVAGWDDSKKTIQRSLPVLINICQGTCNEEILLTCSYDLGRVAFCNLLHRGHSGQDIDSLHPPCIHINAFRAVFNELPVYTSLSTEDDHSYFEQSFRESDCEAMQEIFFAPNCFAVHVPLHGYAVITVRNKSLFCLQCKKTCAHVHRVENLITDSLDKDVPYSVDRILELLAYKPEYSQYMLKAVSSRPIPFSPDENMKTKLWQNPKNLFSAVDGILQAIPLDLHCPKCSGQLHTEYVAEIKQSTLFTRYGCIQVQCYFRLCSIPDCDGKLQYDGQTECVLNMGHFLVHYDVLRDFMFQFLYSRCTMYAFYSVWALHQQDAGNVDFCKMFPYTYFRLSWFSFLGLLDINYEDGFICMNDMCRRIPKVLMCDGTSLAYRKVHAAANDDYLDNNGPILSGSHKDRVFIDSKPAREMLFSYVKGNFEDFDAMNSLLVKHQPSLLPLMEYFRQIGSTDKCPEEYSKLIKVLASPSPICGTFHYTFIDLLEKILEQEKITLPQMKVLQEHCPMLFDMLQTIDDVPSFLKAALREVICKVKITFEGHKGQDTGLPIGPASRDAFYPVLPEVCQRGKYQLDSKKWEVPFCSKKHGRHPTLLPGIFTVFCQHGICYGYQIMKSMESPNIPFTFLKTRFEVAPEAIIYDNACNLHAYCLNRDPVFFARTQFAVDALHWFNHTGCSMGYESKIYPMFKSVNTQIVEQNNSKLKKLKSSLSYMTPHNFHASLRFFLWNCNREMKAHN